MPTVINRQQSEVWVIKAQTKSATYYTLRENNTDEIHSATFTEPEFLEILRKFRDGVDESGSDLYPIMEQGLTQVELNTPYPLFAMVWATFQNNARKFIYLTDIQVAELLRHYKEFLD